MYLDTKHVDRVVLFIYIIVGCVVYFNSLDVPFYFDDADNIQHPSLRLENFSSGTVKEVISQGALKTRPVSNLSFALNYYFGEYRVQGYHLVNILIHIATSFILFLFVQITLNINKDVQLARVSTLLAFSTALLWLVHPTATQSVTYLVQRMNSLASMFYILSMLMYVYGRRTHRSQDMNGRRGKAYSLYCVSLVSGLLAVGSKEMAATLPLTFLMYEWFFIQDLSVKWIKKGVSVLVLSVTLVFSFAWFYTNGNILERTILGYGGRDFTLAERLFTQLHVVVHYISLFFYPKPDRLTFDYDFPLSTSLLSPSTTLYAALILIILLVTGVLAAKKYRLFAFCIFWFFITLSVESSVVPLEIIYEHRLYLPSMMMALATAWALHFLVRRATLVCCVSVAVSLVLSAWTIERNRVWQEPLVFWQDGVKKTPKNARVHVNLGREYFKIGEYEKAKSHYLIATEINPDVPYGYNELGVLWATLGDDNKAEYSFKKAIATQSSYSPSLLNLGRLLFKKKKYDEVISYLLPLAKYTLDAEYLLEVNRTLGLSYMHKGEIEQAKSTFIKALGINDHDVAVLNGYAQVLAQSGDVEGAIELCRKSLTEKEDQQAINYNIALLLQGAGKGDEALDYLRKAADLTKYQPPASYMYANNLLRTGQLELAENYYIESLGDTKITADTLNNLGLIAAQQKKYHTAIQYFTMAVALHPEHSMALNNLRLAEELQSERAAGDE
jgi:Tfp pilus assembly protein PilF